MRIRTIKPEFFLHEGLYDLEQETGLPIRLAFAGLWCAADREGRFKWEPRKLKAQILPYDDVDFSRVLDACLTRGLIVRYASGTREFGVIPSFLKHQVINNRERSSFLPPPPESIAPQGIDACPTREPRVPHGMSELKSGREGNKEQGREQVEHIPAREGSWPAMEDVKAFAQTLCAPPECAEKFWNEMEGVGWERKGTPIVNWRPIFTVYAQAWKSNEARDRKRNGSREFKVPTGGFHE